MSVPGKHVTAVIYLPQGKQGEKHPAQLSIALMIIDIYPVLTANIILYLEFVKNRVLFDASSTG